MQHAAVYAATGRVDANAGRPGGFQNLEDLLTRCFFAIPQTQTLVLCEADQRTQDTFVAMLLGGPYSQRSHGNAHTTNNIEHRDRQSQPPDAVSSAIVSDAAQMPRLSPHIPHDSGSTLNRRINDRAVYGDQLGGSPPFNVRLPQDVRIGMVEINTFFPSSFLIPAPILRAVRNGFTREQLVELQLRAVDRFNSDDFPTAVNRIQQQISKAGKLEDPHAPDRWNTKAYVQRTGQQHDLTTNAWKQRSEHGGKDAQWTDMKLADIAQSVPRQDWPTGSDRLLVTLCLEFAVSRLWLNLDTTHWGAITRNYFRAMVLPQAPTAPNANRDTATHDRLFP
ncbi:hypothetical protein B0A55_09941 [Friedmanniomyces simplex]|uniref:Uncharacterized protein n=1 Tax=Friedmanniomyces simplex TaxID=329884 RepID=A0A4U0WMQ5_9PEZI|nr:hypothetical protein B0A55_09941 [Friedmanniomyces simplex]